MFAEIPLLNAEQLELFRGMASKAVWVSGSSSNPNSKVKDNWQISYEDENYPTSAKTMYEIMSANEELRLFAYPKQIAPPLMSKYEEGNHYGLHADSPIVPAGRGVIRSDISCTVFLSNPETYEGGELCIDTGSVTQYFKPQAGWAVLYPSTFLHEVAPITSGERLAMITFIESHIRDPARRDILHRLNKLKREELSWGGRTDLSLVTACLDRMWS